MHAALVGRYAPSPSGALHIGNLRTALIAWALCGGDSERFAMRIEDLDRVKAGAAESQLADLRALGITWREPVMYQSGRLAAYDRALADLRARGLTYECYCSRKDIQQASSAPHAAPGAYPGTCRDLSAAVREVRRKELAANGRQPAVRLRAEVRQWQVHELIAGVSPGSNEREYVGMVDDVVLRRGDGVIAYNLAVVIDDAAQGVNTVCRGDDLLSSAPRQAYLAHLLGLPRVDYAHVPLVINEQGVRLAKRDGAVTLSQLAECGWNAGDVISWCASSLGLPPVNTAADFARVCTLDQLRSAGGPHVFITPQ